MNCARINCGFSISSTMATAGLPPKCWPALRRSSAAGWCRGGTDRYVYPVPAGRPARDRSSRAPIHCAACCADRVPPARRGGYFPGTAAYPPVQRPAPLRAAGAADHQQALDAGLFDRGEDLLGASSGLFIQVVFAPAGVVGADHRILTAQLPRQPGCIGNVAQCDGQIGVLRQLFSGGRSPSPECREPALHPPRGGQQNRLLQ